MCYLLTMETKRPVDAETIEMMGDVGVYVEDVTQYEQNPRPDTRYTMIGGGCACDIVNQKWDVREILYERVLASNGEFRLTCVLDDGSEKGTLPLREVSYAEFLDQFPQAEQPDVTYHVRERG